MAYQIDRYNRSLLTVVEDGTIDETTDLRFIGKNYAGYGEIHNENFLFLLENFSNANPPPRPLSGQLWFDSGQNKLKFYDGTNWRSTGGSEVSGNQPVGLTIGDFWWDSSNDQLYVYNGASFVLVGPQNAGVGTTQLVSQTILDTDSNPKNIIVAIVNDGTIDVPVAVFSSDEAFTILSDPGNSLDGFDRIYEGITLRDLDNGGVSTENNSSAFRFRGTATDSSRLGGVVASAYVQAANPTFTSQIVANNNGISIGSDFVLSTNSVGLDPAYGEVRNNSGAENEIRFVTKDASSADAFPLTLTYEGLFPGANSVYNLGSSSLRFNEIYADSFVGGSAQVADQLDVDGTPRTADTDATPNTIAARDGNADLYANEFVGTATSAKFADLAEKYTTDQTYPTGTVMAVGGPMETTAAPRGDLVVGVISAEPAFLMNKDIDGQAIALKGRVPVRVVGEVKKGGTIYSNGNGVGTADLSPNIVGIALESKSSLQEALVECVLKV
jgi:hypothetical protein